MARIRYIKPTFFEDLKISELSTNTRLLYIGLWCFMDRQGLVENEPKLIKRNIFPYDDDISIKDVIKMIDALIEGHFLYKIFYQKKNLLHCPTFITHQKFHPNEQGKYLIPEDILNTNLLATCQQPANNALTGIGTGTITGTITTAKTSEQVKPARVSFDFEKVYLNYPRKLGKAEGIRRAKACIKTEEQFRDLQKAVDKYKAYCISQNLEAKFIKHFSTFMSSWQDWLDDDTGKSIAGNKSGIDWDMVFKNKGDVINGP